MTQLKENTDVKTVSEIKEITGMSISGIHKAIKENRIDYKRIGFIYLVYLNDKVYKLKSRK